MKKSRKFVKNDGAKEIIIKSTTKTLSFHTKLDIGKRFIQVNRNMANHS